MLVCMRPVNVKPSPYPSTQQSFGSYIKQTKPSIHMHLVGKTALSYLYFLAQEQNEFLRHTLKLIIEFFNLIPECKSSKLDHSKDNNINPRAT